MQTWFSLPHLTGLIVSGPDALDFCQSQFTADMRKIPEDRWQITAWCNPKGRVLSVILTARHENHVEIIAPLQQAGVLEKLAMYAIGRNITLTAGKPVSGTLTAASDDSVLLTDESRALRLAVPADEPGPEPMKAWRLADLATPLPWLTSDTTGKFLPQALGMESNGGLSYSKGCFPGQEVIARVHYLGHIKYHLMGFQFELPGLPDDEPETFQLQSDSAPDGTMAIVVINSVRVDKCLLGLAVAPVQIRADHPVTATGLDWALPGQMTALERLCYHRDKIRINDGN